jgi:hypothetical protein
MRLVLALPHLLALEPAILARMPGLARIAAFAGVPECVHAGIDAAFAQSTGVPVDASLAQLAARGAGAPPSAAPILFADPVTLVAGRDDVLFNGRVDDLADADAQALIALLNTHFQADGVTFSAPRADAWFVTALSARALTTTPPAMLRGAIYPHLPRGEPAKSWRRWLSEMQMLLHEHPVNETREQAGRAPVTGIWIWGGGQEDWPAPASDAVWCAPAGRAGDVARGLARRAGREATLPLAALADVGPATALHAVLAPAHSATDAIALDASFLAPAATALARGDTQSLVLIADGGGPAYRWRSHRPPLTQRLRHRFGVAPFAPPAADLDA